MNAGYWRNQGQIKRAQEKKKAAQSGKSFMDFYYMRMAEQAVEREAFKKKLEEMTNDIGREDVVQSKDSLEGVPTEDGEGCKNHL